MLQKEKITCVKTNERQNARQQERIRSGVR